MEGSIGREVVLGVPVVRDGDSTEGLLFTIARLEVLGEALLEGPVMSLSLRGVPDVFCFFTLRRSLVGVVLGCGDDMGAEGDKGAGDRLLGLRFRFPVVVEVFFDAVVLGEDGAAVVAMSVVGSRRFAGVERAGVGSLK